MVQKKEAFKVNSISCFNCNKQFKNRIMLNNHLKNYCNHNPIDDISNRLDTNEPHFIISFDQAMRGCINKYTFTPKELIANEKHCLDLLEHGIVAMLKWYGDNKVFLKWCYTLEAMFTRMNVEGESEFKSAKV